MAKTIKFTPINLNHIYDKTLSSRNRNSTTHPIKNPSSSSSTPFSYSAVSAPKPHGRMLVLTRPTSKPKPDPTPLSPQQLPPQIRSEPPPDAISLRPLGRTGSGSTVSPPVLSKGRDKEATVLVSSPKPDKFVPPHLRPAGTRCDQIRSRESGHKHFRPPGRFWEDGRPKSGGDSNLGVMNRPRSSGWNRPSSSGW